MQVTDTSNVGLGLLLIHRVISRALNVIEETCRRYVAEGIPDPAERDGFLTYAQCLITVLEGHHMGEDQVAFPVARNVLKNVPFGQLREEHQAMQGILSRAQVVLTDLPADWPAQLQAEIQALQKIWQPHIRCEELHFSIPALAEAMKLEEHAEMKKAIAEFGQKHHHPDYHVVPFLLHNLTPEDRTLFTREMPPMVTEQLVPLVWKEKWAPMSPFLLA